MFNREGKGKILKYFVLLFQRFKVGRQPKSLVFAGIKSSEESSILPRSKEKGLVFGHFGEINEVQSVIPSHIKRLLTLDAEMNVH